MIRLKLLKLPETAEIRFVDSVGDVCELRLDFEGKTAQYAGYKEWKGSKTVLPMYKAVSGAEQTQAGFNIAPETLPHRCGDFAIANVRYPQKTFKVRVLICCFEKNDCTIIDTEIAETGTLLTNRKSFVPQKIKLTGAIFNEKLFDAEL